MKSKQRIHRDQLQSMTVYKLIRLNIKVILIYNKVAQAYFGVKK